MSQLCVGVLALQGAFREHVAAVASLGATAREVRQLKDIEGIDALIIPGGESTTIGKLLNEWNMLEPLRQRILDGMPVYGSCAGLILLCRDIENSDQPRLGVLDATVRRNAFGRQVDSFETNLSIPEIGADPLPAVFIRAPVITGVGAGVKVLAEVNGQAVAVRQNNILATSFHPELTPDTRMHSYFLSFCDK
ncbi:pyridoxal 5'-phosphate synthase glutaminase subunit PdxT [Desulfovibrio sp.]|uniref:pyridoxal 5'-phosphate synthase glutaminase subunit PdxT n=1 Tax=Desulfovibrio TaxID=872 RepID=UPI0025C39DFA|nr:pyridoxal 5'-phosphate synthase glutaminase subunit PdxT [Desulfovibrio sp.]